MVFFGLGLPPFLCLQLLHGAMRGTAFSPIAGTVCSGNVAFGIGSLSLSDNDQNADHDIHGQRPDKKP
jgi:hypothetical protein